MHDVGVSRPGPLAPGDGRRGADGPVQEDGDGRRPSARHRAGDRLPPVGLGPKPMVPEVRGEFSEIEKLVRLLLVCPASSSEAERSFSALRRLKTWLRSTMTEARLNSVVVCNTHQDLIDSVDTQKLVCTFISRSTIRSNMFGAKLQNE